MRALRGGIPRAFKNQRSPKGYAYRAYCQAKLQRLGALPWDARPLLREAGRIVVELEALGWRRDELLAWRRAPKAELRRLGSEARKLRVQLLLLEARLDAIAAGGRGAHAPGSPEALLEALTDGAAR